MAILRDGRRSRGTVRDALAGLRQLSPVAQSQGGRRGSWRPAPRRVGRRSSGAAHRDLGANWSPSLEINSQQTLTTEGVYGVLRHPMYASQCLYSLAQALLLQNWIAGLAGLAAFVPMYLVRVPREEQMMLDHFGDAYRAYGERTGGILPRLRASFRR